MTIISDEKFNAKCDFIRAVGKDGTTTLPFRDCLAIASEAGLSQYFYDDLATVSPETASRWQNGQSAPRLAKQQEVLKEIRRELTEAASQYVFN